VKGGGGSGCDVVQIVNEVNNLQARIGNWRCGSVMVCLGTLNARLDHGHHEV
jgi:hypothetical protein